MHKTLKQIYIDQLNSGVENLPTLDIQENPVEATVNEAESTHFLHLVFDFQFLYYKYKFAIDSGRMKRLSTPVDVGGVVVEKDVSQIYYALREIESIRKKMEKTGKVVVVSVCFDSKSKRKDGDTEEAKGYKANRGNKLSSDDFDNIELVRKILEAAGYNVYKVDGIEADDLVHKLMDFSDVFDYTVIVTCDLDIAVNVSKNVGLYRFKSSSGYGAIDMTTFDKVVPAELKCNMPYNAIMLYKATVGDKSDNIPGIKKFGPAAFNKLVNYLESFGDIDWFSLTSYEKTREVLERCRGHLSDDQMRQALDSLDLVRPIEISDEDFKPPVKLSNQDMRAKAYMKYNMQSLI